LAAWIKLINLVKICTDISLETHEVYGHLCLYVDL